MCGLDYADTAAGHFGWCVVAFSEMKNHNRSLTAVNVNISIPYIVSERSNKF